MKDDDFIPVVETESDVSSAVIFSNLRGLSFALAQELIEKELSVDIVASRQNFLPRDLGLNQIDLDGLDSFSRFEKADYVFCLHPSARPETILLYPLVQMCRAQNKKLLIVEFYNSAGKQIESRLSATTDLDYRFVYLAQTYGQYPSQFATDDFSRLIPSAMKTGKLTLPADSKTVVYPTNFRDIAAGLILALFKNAPNGKVYFLSTLEKSLITEFGQSIRVAIDEVTNQSLDIDYSLTTNPWVVPDEKLIVSSQAELDWYPNVDLKTGLIEAVKSLTLEIKRETPSLEVEPTFISQPAEPEPQVVEESKPKLKPLFGQHKTIKTEPEKLVDAPVVKRRRIGGRGVKVLLGLFAVILLVTVPLFIFVSTSLAGVNQLKSAVSLAEQGKTGESVKQADLAVKNFAGSRVMLNIARPVLFFTPSITEKYDRLFDAAGRMAQVVKLADESLDQVGDIYTYVVNGSPQIDISDSATTAKKELQDLYNQIALVSASLDKVDFNSRLDYVSTLSEIKKKLPEWQATADTGVKLLDVLPDMLNTKATKNILVVVQNSGELRPTGGFIEGAAVITLRDGHLTNIEYQDIYSLDKQLEGFVDAPPTLKKYLGESAWFLRDANWDPDFPTSAQQIKWFYEKETGTNVDAVVGVNLLTFRTLLNSIGPVELSPWTETVSSVNLFDKITYLAKADTTDSQTANKYPLLELAKVLGGKLTSNTIALPQIAAVLRDIFDLNQLEFYFTDPTLQAKLEQLNWTGSLDAKKCLVQFSNTGCVSETYGLSEANIGINKANLFLDRTISQTTTIDDKGRIDHQIEVEYRNSSTSQAWPGGDYKAFVRFYAPLGSQLNQLKLNDVAIGLEEQKQAINGGLEEYSFPITVRVGENVKLTLGLRSPNILNLFSESSALTINWEKQSGVAEEPMRVQILFPQSLYPEAVNMPTANTPGKLQFLVQFKHDQPLAVQFARN